MIAKHLARASIAVFFGAAAGACGDSSAPLVAAAVESTFPTNVTTVAGTSVAQAPSVKVTSSKDMPVPGVAVTFAVTGGGGTILGASATTGADGIAAVISWTLGTTAGTNTLTATVGTLPVVTITATGIGGPAARLGVATSPSATTANRAAFPTQPVIQVQDQYGNFSATSTASVTATLSSGSGTLDGTTTVAAVAGVAAFTNLSVAGAAGAKTLAFASGGLTPTQATLTTTAGAASAIALSDGNNQGAPPGTAVAVSPAVIVTDADGNPVSGTGVTFEVTSGGGGVTGANPASNALGIAAAGTWTLGPSLGANTMTATSAGLTGSPVTFTAQGTNTSIVSVSPATLTSGVTATITGTGYSATPANNVVSIDGVATAVTAATATQLTVTVPTLPCLAGHDAVVSVNPNNTGAAVKNWPVLAPTQLALSSGQSAILASAATAQCNELSNTGGLYYLAVYNSNTTYDTTGAKFELKGGAGGSSLLAPSRGPTTYQASAPPRSLFAGPPGTELDALAKSDRAHIDFLERDLAFLRQYGPGWRRAASDNALRSVAPVAGGVAHAVGDQVSVHLPDARTNTCTTWLDVSGRVAYVGTHAIIVEDNANPMAGTIDTTYAEIGTEFDNVMYAILEANYGNPIANDAVLDNNGRIVMLFTSKMNASGPLGALGLAGFVTGADFFPTSTCPASNHGEYFYATSPTSAGTISTAGSPPVWRWTMRATIIHEVKHIVSTGERFSRNGGATFETSWLEETTARVSEELYERSLYGFSQKANIGYGSAGNPVGPYCGVRACSGQARGIVRVFEELAAQTGSGGWYFAPPDHSPFGRFSSSDFSFYSTGWSLVRWMLDASGNGESAILKGMTQEPTKTGILNLEQYSGLTFAASQPKWLLSMLVDDYSGFTPADATLKQPSWNLRNVYAGYYADFVVPWTQWPLVATSTAFGAFSLNSRARPGTATIVQLSGPQFTSQLLELKASGVAAAAPAELRLAIIRVQ